MERDRITAKRDGLAAWLGRLTSERGLEDSVEQALHELRLAQDLVALREKRGLTQAVLAARLGVSQPAIAKIESGRAANLQLKTLVRLVTALDGSLVLKVQDHEPPRIAASARSSGRSGVHSGRTAQIDTPARRSRPGTHGARRR